jgi:branched-chain amino acid transport system ATP-binding protein
MQKRQELMHMDAVKEIVSLLNLDELINVPVGTLPFGMQKRVELGRALAAEPSVLILDEPVAGMSNKEKEEIVHYILKAKEHHELTILFVEHDMKIVMDISDYITVLNFGVKIADDVPIQIQKNNDVLEAYLGVPGYE